MDGDRNKRDRRRFIASLAGIGVASVSGCLGGISEDGKRPFADNPVASNLDDRPRLGQPRDETDITLVTFEDPSCSYCATFHENGFDRIKSEWVATGKATVYNRVFPFVDPWGENAIHALVEAHRRDPELYWTLLVEYFDAQDELSEDNVVEKTRSFLADTEVDSDAIVRAARDKTNESYVSTDVDAGEKAGVSSIPRTFVFEDGEFVTTIGEEEFQAFASAVESHE